MEKGVKIASIISGSIIVVALIIAYVIFQIIPTGTISVNGQSQLEVTPDIVTVNFNIEGLGKDASEAKDVNEEIYNNLVSLIKEIGIEEDQIKTSGYNVDKNYEWVNGKRVDKGYIARHYVSIEQPIEDSDNIGEVIDAGVDSGALISYIVFELSDNLENEKKSEATLKATEDARIKAEAMAEGLGKSLGKIVSVSDNNFNYYPYRLYETSTDMAIAEAGIAAKESIESVSLTPSEQTVYGNVAIVYKIM